MTRKGYRQRASEVLERSGALDAILRLRARRPAPWLTVLTYHRIADPEAETEVDRDVIDATPAQFEDQVAHLSRHYTIIGIDELLYYARAGGAPGSAAVITFDDGYRDALTTAVPILERYGARAIFFIATDYPDQGKLFWWDRIAYLVRRSPRARIEMTDPARLSLDLSRGRERAARAAIAAAKRDPHVDLDAFVRGLAEASSAPWSAERERDLASRLIMSWDDVRRLVDLGMDVESHTRTHRILGHLSVSEAAWELHGSREDLRRRLGYAPRAVAYPVGASLADRPDLLAAIRDAGYALGCTNCTGSNDLRRPLHPLDVNRIGMDVALSPEMFRAMLAVPPLGHATWRRLRDRPRRNRDAASGA